MSDNIPGSPLARPLPTSPKIAKLKAVVAKKSPVRSPLRDVLKKRCAERIRNNRDKVVAGFRGSEFCNEVQSIIKDELASLRGSRRRSLTFGFTDEEVDRALQEIQEIEVEISQYAEILSDEDLGNVCPLCLKHAMKERAEKVGDKTLICCPQECGDIIVIQGGMNELMKVLEVQADQHSQNCVEGLSWCQEDQYCLIGFCEACDFCTAVP